METKKIHVNFREDLGYRCPICGQVIQPTDDDGFILDPYEDIIYKVTPCPHLVWCILDENINQDRNDWQFSYVRTDIAQRIVKLIMEDLGVQYKLQKSKIKVSEKNISLFLNGKYEYGDKISLLFARLPITYYELLPPNTTIYQHFYSEDCKMEFAVEAIFSN
jgi:hypothetical protein